MFVESEIMVEVLLTLKGLGVVGLPVHDALVVRASEAARAKAVMLKAFKRHTGLGGEVSVEVGIGSATPAFHLAA